MSGNPKLTPGDIARWVEWLATNNYSDDTIRAYDSDVHAFHDWTRRNSLCLDAWRDVDAALAAWLQAMEEDWSPSSVRRRGAAVKSWAKWAGSPDLLRSYRWPSTQAKEPSPMLGGQDDIERMCDASRSPKQAALIALCGFCGLRVSEAIAVTSSDIDLDERTVLVRGKGNKQRTVPIPERAIPHIKRACNYADRNTTSKLLCQFTGSGARKSVALQAVRAGVPYHVASHDLRRTFATTAYNRCNDIAVVQRLLGHSNPATTMRYIGITQDDMRAAVGG